MKGLRIGHVGLGETRIQVGGRGFTFKVALNPLKEKRRHEDLPDDFSMVLIYMEPMQYTQSPK